MWMLIAALVVGDLVVVMMLRAERRRHEKSRRALAYWRKAHGPVMRNIVDLDMANVREELRRRAHHYKAARAVAHGDVA